MKKFSANIVIYILLANIFYIGSGVNLVHYCCSSCSELGIEALQVEACHTSEDDCCDQPAPYAHHHNDGDRCRLERRSLDMEPSHQLLRVVVMQPITLVLSELPAITGCVSGHFCSNHHGSDPPFSDTQSYRSKICIWII